VGDTSGKAKILGSKIKPLFQKFTYSVRLDFYCRLDFEKDQITSQIYFIVETPIPKAKRSGIGKL
jgi:hypothetical protein